MTSGHMSKVVIAATGQSNWAQEKSFGDMCIDYCSFGVCGQIAVNSEKKCKKVEYFMLFSAENHIFLPPQKIIA